MSQFTWEQISAALDECEAQIEGHAERHGGDAQPIHLLADLGFDDEDAAVLAEALMAGLLPIPLVFDTLEGLWMALTIGMRLGMKLQRQAVLAAHEDIA